MKLSKNLSLCLILFFIACQTDPAVLVEETNQGVEEVPTMLPMKILSLNDLSAFQPTAANWQVASSVYSDWDLEQSLEVTEGVGVLVGCNGEPGAMVVMGFGWWGGTKALAWRVSEGGVLRGVHVLVSRVVLGTGEVVSGAGDVLFEATPLEEESIPDEV